MTAVSTDCLHSTSREPITLSSHPERASRVEGKHAERGVAVVELNYGLDIMQPSGAGVNTMVSRSLCSPLDRAIHALVCVWWTPARSSVRPIWIVCPVYTVREIWHTAVSDAKPAQTVNSKVLIFH